MSLREFKRIILETSQEQLLKKLVEAARNTPPDQRTEFFVSSSITGDYLIHPSIPDSKSKVHFGDIQILTREGLLILNRVSRAPKSFDIKPLGFRYYEHLMQQSGEPVERTEATIMKYLSSENFQKRYPKAYDKWISSERLLWESDIDRQLSTVGHLCREAMQEFTEILIERAQIPDAPKNKSKTIARLSEIIDSVSGKLGRTEKGFLMALVSYWKAVDKLVQRQEHAAQKEGEQLVWEDARRVVFQTLVVMYEVDHALDSR